MGTTSRCLFAVVVLGVVTGLSVPAPLPPRLQKPASPFRQHRDRALEQEATKEGTAAIEQGLAWLAKHQAADGRWKLDGDFPDRGPANDIAGTALGLLPFLGNGRTHEGVKDNPHFKNVAGGLDFLVRQQDKQTGGFTGGMYAHALATLALAEAYGLTRDAKLKGPAQRAVDYTVNAQHAAGGWRYAPGQAGDLSVTGWQVTALQTARLAGLKVPEAIFTNAARFVDSCCDGVSEGYGYVGPTPSPTMSAVGLLLRGYLQGWDKNNPRFTKGIDNHVKATPPGRISNAYYYYYATQAVRPLGGKDWQDWSKAMRGLLIQAQDAGAQQGSWPSTGDAFGGAGGRLLITSLNLLTLEAHGRYLPSPKALEKMP